MKQIEIIVQRSSDGLQWAVFRENKFTPSGRLHREKLKEFASKERAERYAEIKRAKAKELNDWWSEHGPENAKLAEKHFANKRA